MSRICCLFLFLVILLQSCSSPEAKKSEGPAAPFSVIAYYSGGPQAIDSFPIEKLTHIIYSFGHLKGNIFSIDNARDSATIQKLVSLKSRNPSLKVILSLGGWGGCEKCSPVFATEAGRREFAGSVHHLLQYFKADGLDLDWEYPAIEGYPGHAYEKSDRSNFTALLQSLRDSLGSNYELSFAAGGFDQYLYESIDWPKVVPLVDKINLMSYDLVGGYSRVTGHHTPLYSSPGQKQSADNAIRYLDSIKVPMNKMIIGAAFYARVWDSVANINNGLYQKGVFLSFVDYTKVPTVLHADSGFVFYRDSIAQAPYAYSERKHQYATLDDRISIAAKTQYAIDKKLGGIMFWELSIDRHQNGLVEVIDSVRRRTVTK